MNVGMDEMPRSDGPRGLAPLSRVPLWVALLGFVALAAVAWRMPARPAEPIVQKPPTLMASFFLYFL